MFQTVFPSIIRSSKLHIQRQVFVRPILLRAASLACLAARSSNGLTNTWRCVQFCAPDDGRENRLKHVERLTELNEKHCILLVVLWEYISRLSQRCSWRLRSCGVWQRVVGWLMPGTAGNLTVSYWTTEMFMTTAFSRNVRKLSTIGAVQTFQISETSSVWYILIQKYMTVYTGCTRRNVPEFECGVIWRKFSSR